MNPFALKQEHFGQWLFFHHMRGLGTNKNDPIHLNSCPEIIAEGLPIYDIIDGRFEWNIPGQPHHLFPGDAALILITKLFSFFKKLSPPFSGEFQGGAGLPWSL